MFGISWKWISLIAPLVLFLLGLEILSGLITDTTVLWNQCRETNEQIRPKEELITDIIQQRSQIKNLSLQVSSLQAGQLIAEENASLYRYINRLADSLSVNIESIQPGKETRGSEYRTLQLDIAVYASYASSLRFLHALETTGGRLSIEALQVKLQPKAQAKPLFAIQLEARLRI